MYPIQTSVTIKPAINEKISATAPKITGTNAPPIMAVTIKPEISLLRSGMASIVIENTNGKILAKPKPIMNIAANPIIEVVATKRPNIPSIATRVVTLRNL